MRVALNAWFLNQPGTGSGQYLQGLLRAMPGLAPDNEFLLVAPSPVLAGYPISKSESADHGSQIHSWPLKSGLWQSNAGKVLFEQVGFPLACRRWGADVAHVPYWGSPVRPMVPTVVTIHDLIPMLLPAYRGGSLVRAYTRLVAASARRARSVLTDSLASKRDIEQHLHLPAERVHAVYLAAGEHFGPDAGSEDEVIRASYGLPQRYVLYLAGHDERKNVATLVEAFATVAQSDHDVSLIIGSNLPDSDEPPFYDPRPLVDALGIAGDVRFIGWVDEADAPALYRSAACAAFISRYEGFGLPVLEALACGTPLVASNAASLPELVGDAGFALDPDDTDGIAGAILACLVDDVLAAELRRRGPQQAARFTWTETARQTLVVYDQVAGQGAG